MITKEHTSACQRSLAMKLRTASYLSWRLFWSVSLGTIVFSLHTVSFLMTADTVSSILSVTPPPVDRMRSFLKSSSQHSKS